MPNPIVAGNNDNDADERLYKHNLGPNVTYNLLELKQLRPIPLPQTVQNNRFSIGSTLTFVNTSGINQIVCWAKGVYLTGELISTNLQGKVDLMNGQVAYHRCESQYRWKIKYTDRADIEKFAEVSPLFTVQDFHTFDVQIVNGKLLVSEGSVDGEQAGFLYWSIHTQQPELSNWSIDVYYGGELLQTLTPTTKGYVYTDADCNYIKPEAQFKMADYYTVYLLKDDQPDVEARYAAEQRKYLIEIGPKLIKPAQIFAICGPLASNNMGPKTIQVSVMDLDEVAKPARRTPLLGNTSADADASEK